MTMFQQVRQCGLPAQGGSGDKGAAQAGNIPRQQVLPHGGGRYFGVLPVEQHIVPHLDANELVRVSGLQVQIFVNIGREIGFRLDSGRGFRLLRRTYPGWFRHCLRRGGYLYTGLRLFRLRTVRSGDSPRPIRCVRAVGIPFRRKARVRNHVLITALHEVLYQPLPEHRERMERGKNVGISPRRLHEIGHFSIQRVRRFIVIQITVPQILGKAAVPDCPVQYFQCRFIKRNRSDHPLCGSLWGNRPPGDAVDIRQIILRAAPLYELERLGSFRIEAFQCIVINTKGAVSPKADNFKPFRGIHRDGRFCGLLRLGDCGIGFADNLLMEPVTESGIIIILLQQRCLIDRQHRPLDCLVTLQTGKVLVGIGAGVLIRRIRQNHIFDYGRVMLIYLPDSRIIA